MPFAARTILAALALSAVAIAQAPQKPTRDAAAWWKLTSDLAGDSMQGRDTGTEAYQRAAQYVADHFKADGLKPAGDFVGGQTGFFQLVPMHQVDVDSAHSSVEIVDRDGKLDPLRLLFETTIAARAGLPAFTEAPLVFLGYGQPSTEVSLRGKIVVFFNNTPSDLTPEQRAGFPALRSRMLSEAGVVAIISIDNPAAIEPTHWPAAYSRTVTLTSEPQRSQAANTPISLRVSAEAAPKLFAGASANPAKILADAQKGLPLPDLTLPRKLRITIKWSEKEITSNNIIALLPGSNPALAPEMVAVSAHLDGYGFGTPVDGDNLYNGALDDAAYVATLLELAHNLKGKAPARSLLFCIFTGEEKGLLGSVFFTQHPSPSVDIHKVIADFNLDQLRPIFPLKILTMEGIADSTLGDTAKSVAQQFGIELRPDRETERNLFRRSDNYSFVRVGVPIASFIFGYDPGTPEEAAYRDWYARRYHKPQDDLGTPIDWKAAVTFNNFYRALVLAVANNPAKPAWLPASAYAPKP